MFEEAYRENFTRLYRFFYYRSVAKDECEDLLQEVFLRFHKSFGLKELAADEAAKILFGIARNVYREWVRNQIRNQHGEFDDAIEYLGTVEEYCDDGFEATLVELQSDLKKGMETLGDSVRQVIELRFIEGKTRAETAAITGMSEKQVHVYQRRGIATLQKWAAKNGEQAPVSPNA